MALTRVTSELGVRADIMSDLSELEEYLHQIMQNESRIWLLRALIRENLSTRDVFSFAKKQAEMRVTIKDLDPATIRQAMMAKVRDLRATLRTQLNSKMKTEDRIRQTLKEEKYKLKYWLRKIRKPINEERNKIFKKYSKKIDHYIVIQRGKECKQKRQEGIRPTICPSNLSQYKSLTIFGLPEDLPIPDPPIGPFVGDPTITLNKGERSLLSRDPKFSLMFPVDDMDFQIELEKGLGKRRYGKFRENLENIKKKNSLLTQICDNVDIQDKGKKKDHKEKEKARLSRLSDIWSDTKDQFAYDPISRTLDFNGVRPTAYKHNKHVKLPQPLNIDEEFKCEFRRREYLRVLKEYKDTVGQDYIKRKMKGENTKNKIADRDNVHKRKNNVKDEILNLPVSERIGLKSLSKRVKTGNLDACTYRKSINIYSPTHIWSNYNCK